MARNTAGSGATAENHMAAERVSIAKTDVQYLKEFLRIAPLSHAAWRAAEAVAVGDIELERPVLDVGCGFGEFAGVVFDTVETGIDINGADLEQAVRGEKYHRMLWTDARNMPFRSGGFGTVVSISVLEHIENTALAIAEISRVLRPGGMFVFTVPTVALYENLFFAERADRIGLRFLGDIYRKKHRSIFKHISIYRPSWWREQLEANGFVVERQQGTLSRDLLWLHDIFLLTAWPSQLAKLLVGRRLIMSVGIRSAILPRLFGHLLELDPNSEINMLFVARKKG
jgi:SAM-dependent methyltransferase